MQEYLHYDNPIQKPNGKTPTRPILTSFSSLSKSNSSLQFIIAELSSPLQEEVHLLITFRSLVLNIPCIFSTEHVIVRLFFIV